MRRPGESYSDVLLRLAAESGHVQTWRRKPKGGQMSLRAISAELAARGHVNERGKPFNPNSIAAMLARRAS